MSIDAAVTQCIGLQYRLWHQCHSFVNFYLRRLVAVLDPLHAPHAKQIVMETGIKEEYHADTQTIQIHILYETLYHQLEQ